MSALQPFLSHLDDFHGGCWEPGSDTPGFNWAQYHSRCEQALDVSGGASGVAVLVPASMHLILAYCSKLTWLDK